MTLSVVFQSQYSFVECHSADCRHAECRGALSSTKVMVTLRKRLPGVFGVENCNEWIIEILVKYYDLYAIKFENWKKKTMSKTHTRAHTHIYSTHTHIHTHTHTYSTHTHTHTHIHTHMHTHMHTHTHTHTHIYTQHTHTYTYTHTPLHCSKTIIP